MVRLVFRLTLGYRWATKSEKVQSSGRETAGLTAVRLSSRPEHETQQNDEKLGA